MPTSATTPARPTSRTAAPIATRAQARNAGGTPSSTATLMNRNGMPHSAETAAKAPQARALMRSSMAHRAGRTAAAAAKAAAVAHRSEYLHPHGPDHLPHRAGDLGPVHRRPRAPGPARPGPDEFVDDDGHRHRRLLGGGPGHVRDLRRLVWRRHPGLRAGRHAVRLPPPPPARRLADRPGARRPAPALVSAPRARRRAAPTPPPRSSGG